MNFCHNHLLFYHPIFILFLHRDIVLYFHSSFGFSGLGNQMIKIIYFDIKKNCFLYITISLRYQYYVKTIKNPINIQYINFNNNFTMNLATMVNFPTTMILIFKNFPRFNFKIIIFHMSHRSQEMILPSAYWSKLSQEDKNEFQRLRAHFHQSQKVSSKDPRLVSFSNELHSVLKFIERSEQGRECRTILTGVAFAGPFICVNTRLLKSFLGRCKSSINGSFQQLGYVAIKTKSKARSCVLAIMPTLINDQNILRQWTVRCASEDAKFCFVTSLVSLQLPVVTSDDLNEDHKLSRANSIPNGQISGQINSQIGTSSILNPIASSFHSTASSSVASISSISPAGASSFIQQQQQQLTNQGFVHHVSWANDFATNIPEMPISYSVECFSNIGDSFPDPSDYNAEWNPMYEKSMTRSQSANFANDSYGAFTLDFSMF
ncbi:hypothetical protein TRFO_26584 [Tritrichomonas foetus]|uniref:Initiator binding domain-containing protein n=1 Tax=Tritrichomonas foetus TaxID=1144522 RepID=A0A1J4K797_9EUKA|nr:hypothetical protein TRFO_26584 [Tritrichomonas foetus]|eukprot:OHT05588.1 hypothetical protein TRFO_26584 [Tritrichomonas foetus]